MARPTDNYYPDAIATLIEKQVIKSYRSYQKLNTCYPALIENLRKLVAPKILLFWKEFIWIAKPTGQ
jgi:hypothetical protein